ncbi:hypothetical protein V6N11_023715 [Hibiscus sabdariffa]|uniref:RNase H type-1 domain-containing protein n=1 Tax=Hibiscus sabdariffa TaxID=183260 RepID=A0ABR2TNV1_9ROSI
MRLISFDSVLNEHGEWDVMKLSSIFTMDVVTYILGIKPPDPYAGSDMCVWRWTAYHDFELKSAYASWSQSALATPDPIWKRIWDLQVPQRLRCFLWLTCQQKFMTNETNRNDTVFAEVTATVEQVIGRSVVWANYYNDSWPIYVQVTNSASTSTPWKKPESGWLCLNVDGAVSLTIGKATIGGLLRDSAGNFLFGFSKFIGCANSLHAELWSLHVGLQLAWDYGIKFLQVQTDCKQVIQLLHGSHVESCPISLVHSIRQLWKRAWFIDLIWISRFGNMAADKLARIANHSSFDLCYLSTLPTDLCDILVADVLDFSL